MFVRNITNTGTTLFRENNVCTHMLTAYTRDRARERGYLSRVLSAPLKEIVEYNKPLDFAGLSLSLSLSLSSSLTSSLKFSSITYVKSFNCWLNIVSQYLLGTGKESKKEIEKTQTQLLKFIERLFTSITSSASYIPIEFRCIAYTLQVSFSPPYFTLPFHFLWFSMASRVLCCFVSPNVGIPLLVRGQFLSSLFVKIIDFIFISFAILTVTHQDLSFSWDCCVHWSLIHRKMFSLSPLLSHLMSEGLSLSYRRYLFDSSLPSSSIFVDFSPFLPLFFISSDERSPSCRCSKIFPMGLCYERKAVSSSTNGSRKTRNVFRCSSMKLQESLRIPLSPLSRLLSLLFLSLQLRSKQWSMSEMTSNTSTHSWGLSHAFIYLSLSQSHSLNFTPSTTVSKVLTPFYAQHSHGPLGWNCRHFAAWRRGPTPRTCRLIRFTNREQLRVEELCTSTKYCLHDR